MDINIWDLKKLVENRVDNCLQGRDYFPYSKTIDSCLNTRCKESSTKFYILHYNEKSSTASNLHFLTRKEYEKNGQEQLDIKELEISTITAINKFKEPLLKEIIKLVLQNKHKYEPYEIAIVDYVNQLLGQIVFDTGGQGNVTTPNKSKYNDINAFFDDEQRKTEIDKLNDVSRLFFKNKLKIINSNYKSKIIKSENDDMYINKIKENIINKKINNIAFIFQFTLPLSIALCFYFSFCIPIISVLYISFLTFIITNIQNRIPLDNLYENISVWKKLKDSIFTLRFVFLALECILTVFLYSLILLSTSCTSIIKITAITGFLYTSFINFNSHIKYIKRNLYSKKIFKYLAKLSTYFSLLTSISLAALNFQTKIKTPTPFGVLTPLYAIYVSFSLIFSLIAYKVYEKSYLPNDIYIIVALLLVACNFLAAPSLIFIFEQLLNVFIFFSCYINSFSTTPSMQQIHSRSNLYFFLILYFLSNKIDKISTFVTLGANIVFELFSSIRSIYINSKSITFLKNHVSYIQTLTPEEDNYLELPTKNYFNKDLDENKSPTNNFVEIDLGDYGISKK